MPGPHRERYERIQRCWRRRRRKVGGGQGGGHGGGGGCSCGGFARRRGVFPALFWRTRHGERRRRWRCRRARREDLRRGIMRNCSCRRNYCFPTAVTAAVLILLLIVVLLVLLLYYFVCMVLSDGGYLVEVDCIPTAPVYGDTLLGISVAHVCRGHSAVSAG